jgi:hypothetical protein
MFESMLCLQDSPLAVSKFSAVVFMNFFIMYDEFTTIELRRKQIFSCVSVVGVYVVTMSQCFLRFLRSSRLEF